MPLIWSASKFDVGEKSDILEGRGKTFLSTPKSLTENFITSFEPVFPKSPAHRPNYGPRESYNGFCKILRVQQLGSKIAFHCKIF